MFKLLMLREFLYSLIKQYAYKSNLLVWPTTLIIHNLDYLHVNPISFYVKVGIFVLKKDTVL
jgi:hypothetical protein